MGLLVGGALALCGAVYQSIFRNPLASPYTLGVSSGAALGATAGMMFVRGMMGDVFSPLLCSVFGALATIVIVSSFSRALKGDIQTRLLLSGVMLSFFLSSVILFLQYLGDFSEVFRMTRWMMGSVDTVGYESLFIVAPVVILGSLIIIVFSEEMTVLSLGYEFAASKGVETEKVIKKLFIITSIMIGVIVSFCGPIGFVGIAVPFVARIIGGSHYKIQLPISFLLGGILLTVCDTVGRTIVAPAEIPVGVITALTAAPIVMILLCKGEKHS